MIKRKINSPGGEIKKLIKTIRMVVFDFDGVFTTNQVIILENGLEGVICNRSDGLGLDMLRKLGIKMAIISTEKNPVVNARAKKLRIDCYSAVKDKGKKIKALSVQKKVNLNEIAYVSNDINDLECLELVGLPIAVADAYPEVKKVAKIVLTRNGGNAAVRELCELIYTIKKEIK